MFFLILVLILIYDIEILKYDGTSLVSGMIINNSTLVIIKGELKN